MYSSCQSLRRVATFCFSSSSSSFSSVSILPSVCKSMSTSSCVSDNQGEHCSKCGAIVGPDGRAISSAKRRVPALAADAAVLRHHATDQGKDKLQLLMIKRGGRTFHGCLAFPGGFVEYGEEPSAASLRELKEETGLVGTNPRLIGLYGNPNRGKFRFI